MAAVLLRARADLRSHWRVWVTLALLVGLMGGAVTAVAAGARRTDSAFGRFLAATRTPDVFLFPGGPGDPSFANLSYEEISRLPEVADVARASLYSVADPPDAALYASPDPRTGDAILRHKILAGRLPSPDRADEVMVSFTTAADHRLSVGGTVRLSLAASGREGGPPTVPFTFRIVGIEASANDFPPHTSTQFNNVWATPAFYRTAAGQLSRYDIALLRLRNGGRAVPALQAELRSRASGVPAQVFVLSDQSRNTQRSIHLQAVALWVLATLLALAGMLVLAQLIVRQSHLESGENPGLRALGMTRVQLWAVSMARVLTIGVVGATIAVVTALALSPLTPIGLARTAEPAPGLAVDAVALTLGGALTVLLVALAGSWPAWRMAASAGRRPLGVSGQARPSGVAEALSRLSAPVPVTAGMRLALDPGQGRTAVPVRSTFTGAIVGVAALATALVFGASLDHLLQTPSLYGITWDARVLSIAADDVRTVLPSVRDDPAVAAVSVGYSGVPVTLGSLRVDLVAVEPVQGQSLLPVPTEGRLPAGPDEVVLGRSTMTALAAHVGSTVQAIVADATPEPTPLRVVGVAIFPSLSDSMGLGRGAATTAEALRRMLPGDAARPPDTILIRLRPGVDRVAALSRLQARLPPDGSFAALRPERPVDLVNFGRVQSLPLVLGGLLGAFAVITLIHLLVTSIRRRRPDLAILKTLGLTSRQVRATVAWQSTTLSVVAVVIGIPLGMAAGRWVWVLFAHQLGILPEPVFPVFGLGALASATVVVANLVAVLPGRLAGRTSPAVVLRSE